ncbi:discoidin domain-containing receptor 2-like [Copidosoma floridanum]|uniref:discoidin domain-containing receptor 2-like n=1 Tax=Copidosoma floridanum TaxID=29053 RepID=UPI0006C953C5|nr:discoidin domain-containing receptor 2-like [Copidosoma floridanum]
MAQVVLPLLIGAVLAAVAISADELTRNVFSHCTLPLGMEEGKIPDDAISASSSYEMKSVGPQNARIRQEKNGGAWCPKAQISNDIREYLEVDLTQEHLITWTETQGRFGNGEGQEYAEAFYLEYWRDAKWHAYKNLRGSQVLRGNSNTYLVERQKLDLPFVASRVRFVPYSKHPRTVCMRVEIYGCVWEQRIARYTIPKGERYGPNGCNLEDSSYDGGNEVNGTLAHGMGQLTDNVIGDSFEILAPLPSSGSSWIGWMARDTLDIVFEFKEVREFNNCRIHVAHLPRLGIEVFASVQAWFSNDGVRYETSADKVETPKEFKTNVGMVTVPLQLRTGRFVKLDIRTRSKWLLISEVLFDSVPGLRNQTSEQASEQSVASERNETDVTAQARPKSERNDTVYERAPKLTPDAFPIGNSQTYIGLVSAALMVLVLLSSCTIFLMKQRGRNKVALLQKHTALLCGPTAPGINMKDIHRLATPIVVNNGLSQSRLSIKSKSLASALAVANDDNMSTLRSNTNRSDNGSEYEQCSAYERTYKLFSEENLAYEPASTHKSERFSTCSGVTDYASENSYQEEKSSERIVPTPFPVKRHSHNNSKANPTKVHEGYYAATDILTIKRREQQSASSLFTPLQIQESATLSNTSSIYNIQHISRHRLRILDKFGEGSFGLVYLCEAKGISGPDIGTIRIRQIVIVRSLWRGVTDSLKKDFMKDMHLLAAIRDVNVARIIALVDEEPMGAVFEYGELGDLPTFMKSGSENGNDDITLSYGCLLNFVTQISSGMKYLENLKIPHCDLAARNCIVNKNLIIKVSDHALYCSKYDHEYYVNGYYAKVPLRWMAWEAVLMGKCSSASDVWSYAVTAWEIFSSCSELPFAELTSEQVLENCSRWYQNYSIPSNNNQQQAPRVLPQPSLCPRELYRMMSKCWSRRSEDRPTFEDIYLFLKRLTYD